MHTTITETFEKKRQSMTCFRCVQRIRIFQQFQSSSFAHCWNNKTKFKDKQDSAWL